ncbi:MAG: phosphate/phosphite/phosphonate ABC transporter substrate-binding protein [Nitrospirota bacterium]
MFSLRFKIILYVSIVLPALLLSLRVNAGEKLVFAVHPYMPATELVERFTPLIKYLGKELGETIEIRVSRDYQNHITDVGKDRVDIAYMGPASYVKLIYTYGRKPLLARQEINGRPTFHGVIIVRKDSPLRSLAELEGKRFAFGDPESTMSYILPSYMLWKEKIPLDKLGGYSFLDNHYNVALGVLAGDFDAGAVKEEVFYEYEKRGLRELVKTPEISDHVFVATNRLSPEKIRKVRTALYALSGNEEGRNILNSIKATISLVPAREEDYDNLHEILHALENIGPHK